MANVFFFTYIKHVYPFTRRLNLTEPEKRAGETHLPWAELHKRNGGAREDDGEEHKGFAAPDVRESTNQRRADKRQHALRAGTQTRCHHKRVCVKCIRVELVMIGSELASAAVTCENRIKS